MDSVIQCWVKSGYPNVRIVAVVWRRLGPSPPLLSFIGGVLKQSPRFQLAEPGWDESRAVVSLLVRATRVADEGLYHCLVLTDHGYAEKTARLRVTARYTGLIMSSVPESNIQDKTAVDMFCSAQGGYPMGAIRWFDQYGTDWSRSAETVARGTADGRFNIVSKLAVRRASSASPRYRCCLLNGAGDKEAEAGLRLSFALPGQEKVAAAGRSHKAVTASVIVLGSLVCGSLVLVLLQRCEGCTAAQRHFDEEPVRVTDGWPQGVSRRPNSVTCLLLFAFPPNAMVASRESLILLVFSSLTLSSKAQRKFLYLRPGDGFSINCSDSDRDIQSVNLYREDDLLFSYDGSSDPMRETREASRVRISGTLQSLRFTLTEINDFHSGIYYCKYTSASGASNGNATLVAVSGENCSPAHSSVSAAGDQGIFLILTTVFSVLSVFIYIVLLIIWLIPKVKKFRERKAPGRCSDSVYEVMQMHVRRAEASKR
ncbi:uncharacterized protein [Paramormyrops kingsleyae]|nr:uncharacterized protein LOC111834166 isoform X2 [Paramormyrops kingsleyae]XP_023648958.1 uncharacterized protein LOC111834166 isoform X2 [Paramormyrops kingsleyae]